MAGVESFHFKVVGQLESVSSDRNIVIPITYTGDAVAPDRTSGQLTLSVIVFVLQMDVIMIGEEVWTTNIQTGVWEKQEAESFGLPNPALLVSGGDPALDDARIVREETIEGVRMIRLSGKARLGGTAGVDEESTTAEVWVGVDDRLVYRIRYSGNVDLDTLSLDLSAIGLGGVATLDLDMALSGFDEPVEIERPVP